MPGYRTVLLDFYGTLAEMAPAERTWDDVLAEAGYAMSEEARRRYWDDGIDGAEHDEHSRSRDDYVAWQRTRTRTMLADCGVPDHEHDALVEAMHEVLVGRAIRAYEEVEDVLVELRARGLTLAICSNWDWDLHEAIDGAGLTGLVDVVVSSAWVGARKPHPRIYRHTLELAGAEPEATLFVGDTWSCDVDGPRTAGLRAVYLRRSHFGPDRSAPEDHFEQTDVARACDLRALLGLV